MSAVEARIDEARAFLAAHPAVEAAQIFITDPSGVPRGKTIARSEIETLYTTGRNVAGSIVGARHHWC